MVMNNHLTLPSLSNITFMYLYSDHDINRTKLFLHKHLETALPE